MLLLLSQHETFKANYKGKSYEVVSSIPNDLLCESCYQLADEPHLTDCCSKLVCRVCECCSKQGKRSPDLRTKKSINDLNIKCKNSLAGCKWVGKLRDGTNHLSECQKEMVPCIYREIGCVEHIHRDELVKHEEDKWRIHMKYFLENQMSMKKDIEHLLRTVKNQSAEMKRLKERQDRRSEILRVLTFPHAPNFTVQMKKSHHSKECDHWMSTVFYHRGYLLRLVIKLMSSSSAEYYATVVGSDFDDVTWPCSGILTIKYPTNQRIHWSSTPILFKIKEPTEKLGSHILTESSFLFEDLPWSKLPDGICDKTMLDEEFELEIGNVVMD